MTARIMKVEPEDPVQELCTLRQWSYEAFFKVAYEKKVAGELNMLVVNAATRQYSAPRGRNTPPQIMSWARQYALDELVAMGVLSPKYYPRVVEKSTKRPLSDRRRFQGTQLAQ